MHIRNGTLLLNRICLIVVMFILISCGEEDEIPRVQYDVPRVVQSFIDAFEEEALRRGMDINIEDLIVDFGTDLGTTDVNAAGICQTQAGSTPRITLDSTSINWTNGPTSREILVFHELGHCILGYLPPNAHRDDLLPNGNVKSIMHSGGTTIYGQIFNFFKREYYIDELFEPDTPAPEWATNTPEYNSVTAAQKIPILIEDFNDNANGWEEIDTATVRKEINQGVYTIESKDGRTHFAFIDQLIPTQNDFEIEIGLRIFQGRSSVTLEWGGSDVNNTSIFGFTADKSVFLGKRSFGVSFSRTFDSFNPSQLTKYTIRKIGNSYYFYINEQLFDNGSFEDFEGSMLGFGIGPNNTIVVNNLYINEI